MKVYLVGAHSTGKTTLARWISKRYKLPMLSEVARTVIAEREVGLSRARSDIDLINSLQEEIFNRQVEAELSMDSFVSDRAFDFLAYEAEHATTVDETLRSERLKRYICDVGCGATALLFVRPQRELLVDDGVRAAVDWDSVVRIDGMMKFMLEMFGLSYLSINTPNMQERIRMVEFCLNS